MPVLVDLFSSVHV